MDLLTPTLAFDFPQPPTLETKRTFSQFDGGAVIGIDGPFPVLLAPLDLDPLTFRPSVGTRGEIPTDFTPGIVPAQNPPQILTALGGTNEETLGIAKPGAPVQAGTFTGPRGGNISVVALFGGLLLAVILIRRSLS